MWYTCTVQYDTIPRELEKRYIHVTVRSILTIPVVCLIRYVSMINWLLPCTTIVHRAQASGAYSIEKENFMINKPRFVPWHTRCAFSICPSTHPDTPNDVSHMFCIYFHCCCCCFHYYCCYYRYYHYYHYQYRCYHDHFFSSFQYSTFPVVFS